MVWTTAWLRCIPIAKSRPHRTVHGSARGGSYPIIDNGVVERGNLAAGAQAWAAALAREISTACGRPGFSATVSGRPTGRAGLPGGTWCSVRSCADGFLLFDELERCPVNDRLAGVHPDETGPCWSRSTTGSPWPVLRKGRTWSRWTRVGKSRPASSLASHARRRLPRSFGRGRDARRSGPTPRCPRVHAARSSR